MIKYSLIEQYGINGEMPRDGGSAAFGQRMFEEFTSGRPCRPRPNGMFRQIALAKGRRIPWFVSSCGNVFTSDLNARYLIGIKGMNADDK